MRVPVFAVGAAALLALGGPAQAAHLADFTINRTTPGDVLLIAEVDAFRANLGALNAPAPVNNPDGRREINWDGAPDAVSDPNPFPGDFFNQNFAPRARGAEFLTVGAGTGFLLSSTAASGQPVRFGFPGDFVPFSEERLFSPIDNNVFDIVFRDPVNPAAQALVDGFGAIFNDVETVSATFMDFFDITDTLIHTLEVPIGPTGSLSFAGATFSTAEVARVRVNLGTGTLFGNGSFSGEVVVMDDLIFGEPIPVAQASEPAALALVAGGVFGALAFRRRQQA